MEAFVRRVLQRNYDLRLAAERLESARATARVQGAARLPQLSAGLSGNRQSTVAELPGGPFESTRNAFGLSLDLRWEIDVWGRLRNSESAALADAEGAEADFRAARLSLAANAARAWYDAVEARLQRDLARQTAQSFERTAALIRDRFERGLNRALDLRLALANAADARANLELREQNLTARLRALEVLSGDYPAGIRAVTAELPSVPPAIPAGLPSGLLTRRPDILSAERSFASAQQRRLRAAKDLLPALSLTASGGTRSSELDNLVNGDYAVWNLLGNLTAPLFRGGELRARKALAESAEEQAALNYARTVIEAFSEVEQALVAEHHLAARANALQESATQSTAAENLAWEEYTNGLRDITTVLDAQRRNLNAGVQHLNARNERLQNRLRLLLALGGDFAPPPDDPSVNFSNVPR